MCVCVGGGGGEGGERKMRVGMVSVTVDSNKDECVWSTFVPTRRWRSPGAKDELRA